MCESLESNKEGQQTQDSETEDRVTANKPSPGSGTRSHIPCSRRYNICNLNSPPARYRGGPADDRRRQRRVATTLPQLVTSDLSNAGRASLVIKM